MGRLVEVGGWWVVDGAAMPHRKQNYGFRAWRGWGNGAALPHRGRLVKVGGWWVVVKGGFLTGGNRVNGGEVAGATG